MGGLLGVWNWATGKKKCKECGSYDTKQIDSFVSKETQKWQTDWAFPRDANNVRPQSLFTDSVVHVYSKCNDCDYFFVDIDIKTRRS
jgi:hypothetical protein